MFLVEFVQGGKFVRRLFGGGSIQGEARVGGFIHTTRWLLVESFHHADRRADFADVAVHGYFVSEFGQNDPSSLGARECPVGPKT